MSDGSSAERTKLLAAAQAAASWARARRATWTTAPLPAVDPPPTPRPEIDRAQPAPKPAAVPAERPPAAPARVPQSIVVEPIAHPAVTPPPMFAQSSGPRSDYRPPLDSDGAAGRKGPSLAGWVVRVGAAALIAAAAVAGIYVAWPLVHAPSTDTGKATTVDMTTEPMSAPSGGIRVNSDPSGADVIVDGRQRGVTPLTIDGVAPGTHIVEIRSGEGTLRRSVSVTANKVATVDESIFSGWVAFYSPFDVTISEGNHPLRADDRNQVMLPAGPHDLRFVNRTLEFETTRHVDVKPGETSTISLSAPQSALTITSADASDIWIDGTHVGQTPLQPIPVDIGVHEVISRRAGVPDRHFSITVTSKPSSLDISK